MRQNGGIFRGSRRQRGGRRQRHKQKRPRRRRRQVGGVLPFLIPLLAAGITAAGGIGASAAHAAISR